VAVLPADENNDGGGDDADEGDGTDNIQPYRGRVKRLLYTHHRHTRNSSGDEIANVNNFLYDDIVHALQNTIDWCINSATDRRGYELERNVFKSGLARMRTISIGFFTDQ